MYHFNVQISCLFILYDVSTLLCMQSGISKRIEEKKNELDSLELQISNENFSQLDERERNLVRVACSLVMFCNLYITFILDMWQI